MQSRIRRDWGRCIRRRPYTTRTSSDLDFNLLLRKRQELGDRLLRPSTGHAVDHIADRADGVRSCVCRAVVVDEVEDEGE